MLTPLANLLFAPENWVIIGVIALLLFGKRLPEVGRSLGKGIVEFKKGLAGIEEDVTQAGKAVMTDQSKPASNYKFDPMTGKPLDAPAPAQSQMRFDPYTGKPLANQPAETTTSNS